MELLSFAEFAHNSRQHSATGKSPFEILYGYNPPYSADVALNTNVPAVAARIKAIQEVQEEAASSLRMAAQHAKDRDSHRKLPQWREGTLLWLEGTHIHTTHPKAKLAPRRYGPFKVKGKVGTLAYRLEIPQQWKIHPVFHASMLTEYHETTAHGKNFPKPPPEILNEEEHFEVEAVLDSKRHGRGTKYLVKWVGYPEADNSWEPWALLKGTADEALQEYHRRYPNRPKATGLQVDAAV